MSQMVHLLFNPEDTVSTVFPLRLSPFQKKLGPREDGGMTESGLTNVWFPLCVLQVQLGFVDAVLKRRNWQVFRSVSRLMQRYQLQNRSCFQCCAVWAIQGSANIGFQPSPSYAPQTFKSLNLFCIEEHYSIIVLFGCAVFCQVAKHLLSACVSCLFILLNLQVNLINYETFHLVLSFGIYCKCPSIFFYQILNENLIFQHWRFTVSTLFLIKNALSNQLIYNILHCFATFWK